MRIFGCMSLGITAKLVEAAFGQVRPADWEAVVGKPPGDMISAKQSNRAQGVFRRKSVGARRSGS